MTWLRLHSQWIGELRLKPTCNICGLINSHVTSIYINSTFCRRTFYFCLSPLLPHHLSPLSSCGWDKDSVQTRNFSSTVSDLHTHICTHMHIQNTIWRSSLKIQEMGHHLETPVITHINPMDPSKQKEIDQIVQKQKLI